MTVDPAETVIGSKRPLGERLFPMPVEGEPVYEHCGIPSIRSTAKGVSPEVVESLVGPCFARHRRHHHSVASRLTYKKFPNAEECARWEGRRRAPERCSREE